MSQFGWQALGNLSFVKEGEILNITFKKGKREINTVRYQLRPNLR